LPIAPHTSVVSNRVPLLRQVRVLWMRLFRAPENDSASSRVVGEQPSRQLILAWMHSARVADRLARRGSWQEALDLLQATAARMSASVGPLELVPDAGALELPEPIYRRARKRFAARARVLLADSLARPLARWRHVKRRMGLALAVLAAIVLSTSTWRALREHELSVRATWRASSASVGAIEGTFTGRRIYENLPSFFVHTEEQSEPWIEIDLHGVHTVDRVVVVNRYDAHYERARGLAISVSLDGEDYDEVAARDKSSIFRRWEVDLDPVPARYVRLQLPGEHRILHLADVRIYGR
jgi:hypothetical protein